MSLSSSLCIQIEIFNHSCLADLWLAYVFRNDHHAPEDVPEALNNSLNDLQLEYLDLFLVRISPI
jgi:diketogulonate reductase-like aldo/keto reductase